MTSLKSFFTKSLEFLGVLPSHRFRRRKLRVVLLIAVLATSVTSLFPVITVRGVVQHTSFFVAGPISIDSGRIAFTNLTTSPSFSQAGKVFVYDTLSNTNTVFDPPAGSEGISGPVIFQDKVVVLSINASAFAQVYYCTLPSVTPLSPCGSWVKIADNVDPGCCLAMTFRGDVVTWQSTGGFSYYRFSSRIVTFVNTVFSPSSVMSTNGRFIAFTGKAASPSSTLMYYDTQATTPTIIDTHLPALGGTSVSDTNTIAFNDNSTTTTRIRYYDILRNQPSASGSGPIGQIPNPGLLGNSGGGSPMVSGNRIVYSQSCPAGTCLGWWNTNSNSWIADFLQVSAAPSISASLAIDGNIIAFAGSDGTLQYVRVPIKGDVDQNGVVNINDLSEVLACYGSNLLTLSQSSCNGS